MVPFEEEDFVVNVFGESRPFKLFGTTGFPEEV